MSELPTDEMCACGKPLHYTKPEIERAVRKLIAELGENIDVELTNGQTYSIPRHFIALHGITGKDVKTLARRYGFEKVK